VPTALYAEAWPVYRALGWHGTIPLPAGRKYPPPTDTTGWHAPMPSGADCQAWADEPPLPGHHDYRGTTQLALRLPDTVIGIDVDAYGTKVGGQTIAEAIRRWGPLPDGPWSSARPDGVSGIRFYRVPAATVLATVIKFEGIEDDQRLGGVEVIQHHHRYAVVWPSIHPSGLPYGWRGTDGPGLAPHLDDLPPLPDTWLDGLRAASMRADRQGSRAEANELLRRMPDGDCPTMRAQVERTVDELRSGRASRHDAALTGVLRVIRLGEMGHRGALDALGTLQRAFIAAVADRADETQADDEFARMVYGPNGTGLVLSTPTASTDYGCKHGQQAMPRGIRLAAVDGKLVLAEPGRSGDEDGDEDPPAPGSRNLPEDFWDQRAALKHIRQAAAAGWACADAVLAAMLARQASHMTPDDTVDVGLGPGPLNLFAILYGPPSAGKGVAAKVAKRTLPRPEHLLGCDYEPHPRWRERPLGSGEGLVDSYFGNVEERHPDDDTRTRKVKKQVRRSLMFTVDEGEAFTRKAQRNGTTIAQVIRSAWSGEMLGDANATAERDRQLDEGSYAIGMTILFQPETIGPLFDAAEVGGGTPHRILYAAADNDLLPEQPPTDIPADPGPLVVHHRQHEGTRGPVRGDYPRFAPLRFVLADEGVRAQLIAARWAGLRRDPVLAELDGKRNEMRGRVAAILAWWDDGRTELTAEDWDIAGQILDTSDRVRDAAIAVGTRKVQAQRDAEDTRYVLREAAAREAALAVEEQRANQRIAALAARLARTVLAKAPVEGMRTGDLKDVGGGRYSYDDFKQACGYAVDAEWLTVQHGARKSVRYLVGPKVGEVPAAE
jgi:hypothetical protein